MSDRRVWLAGAVVAGTLLLVAGIMLVQDRDAVPSAGPQPTPSPAIEATSTPAPPDLTWEEAGGVALPVSGTHGPRLTQDGLASGWSESEPGAAIAAAHLLIRTGPTVGPEVFEPTITGQTTGPNVAALKLAVNEQYAELQTNSTAPAAGAQLVGYRIGSYGDDAATVDLVLESADLSASDRYLQVTVSLRWMNDDWWLVAPPNGDWAQVSTPLGSLPDGLQRYEDLG